MAEDIGARPVVCVLGRLRVVQVDGSESVPAGAVPRALLLAVALMGGAVHTDQAIEAVWPEAPIHAGRVWLRNALARLTASCGPVIRREGATLALHAETDLERFERAALAALRAESRGEAIAALELAKGPLAPDALYEEWGMKARESYEVLRGELRRRIEES